ncbi:hypothetical protein [Alloacidobacterium dinghuense]|uniref:hypothetical protein n=1 Tax=Alloacidobacterium dinghuense TaxID=2763107 RepID=UPI00203743D8|nr:hypothetical protein [Alloacidobacterium dinghuense]
MALTIARDLFTDFFEFFFRAGVGYDSDSGLGVAFLALLQRADAGPLGSGLARA